MSFISPSKTENKNAEASISKGPNGRLVLEESEELREGIFDLAGMVAIVSGNPIEGDCREMVLMLL
jgi:hypothetical protein